jgi:hypothetical protein
LETVRARDETSLEIRGFAKALAQARQQKASFWSFARLIDLREAKAFLDTVPDQYAPT